MTTLYPSFSQTKDKGISEKEKIERGELKNFKSQQLITFKTDNKDLDVIVKEWTTEYTGYKKDRDEEAKRAEMYWKGLRDNYNYALIDQPVVDNILFEAAETFLPQATATNPDPVVFSVNQKEYINASKYIRTILENLNDSQVLQQKLKSVARNWLTAKLGAVKIGWDSERDEIETRVVRVQSLILDKNATIDENGYYTGEYIGENRVIKSEVLKNIVRKADKKRNTAIALIDEKGKDGTKIMVQEFWTKEMVFWSMDGKTLARMRNPHYNFDIIENEEETEDGITIFEEEKGINHFAVPEMPYIFFSVFNLGLHPYDDTGPFEQNILKQDTIDRRQYQIEDNVMKMNNSIAFGGAVLSKEQAAEAYRNMRAGKAMWFPESVQNPRDGVANFAPPPLNGDVYRNLEDMRNQLRNSFGTSGLGSSGLQQENTVRGKILNREADSSRIGGTITSRLEQFADKIFNYWVQMIFVYYEQKNYEKHLGVEDTQELMALLERNAQSDMPICFNVSVKNGSMMPKDPMTKRNEAIELAQAGLIDPLTLFERLDDADPRERARRLLLSKSDPMAYMRDILEIEPTQQQEVMSEEVITSGGSGGEVSPGTQTEALLEQSFDNII